MIKTLITSLNDFRTMNDTKIQTYEDTIQQLRALREKAVFEGYEHGIIADILEPLAIALCERMHIKYYDFYGPFGINAEISLYLCDNCQYKKGYKRLDEEYGVNGDIAICDEPCYALDVTPEYDDSGKLSGFKYWTGDLTTEYSPNSIGYLNGGNKVREVLPDGLNDIIAILRKTDPSKKEK